MHLEFYYRHSLLVCISSHPIPPALFCFGCIEQHDRFSTKKKKTKKKKCTKVSIMFRQLCIVIARNLYELYMQLRNFSTLYFCIEIRIEQINMNNYIYIKILNMYKF